MSIKTAFTRVSSNKKTGPIPTSVTSSETCPDACPLKESNTCYAGFGHLKIHWNKVNKGERGLEYDEFLKKIEELPNKTLWRHNVAGDLPGENNSINVEKLNRLVKANKGKNGFTYTHKPVLAENGGDVATVFRNKKVIGEANKNGFAVNLSADDLEEADKLVSLGIGPVVTILPSDQNEDLYTENGVKVKVCPATQNDKTTCANCGICAKTKRKFIVGFPAHGTNKNKLNSMLNAKN